MKRVIALAVLLFGASDLIAAVKIESSVNKGMKIGSTKLFKKAPKGDPYRSVLRVVPNGQAEIGPGNTNAG